MSADILTQDGAGDNIDAGVVDTSDIEMLDFDQRRRKSAEATLAKIAQLRVKRSGRSNTEDVSGFAKPSDGEVEEIPQVRLNVETPVLSTFDSVKEKVNETYSKNVESAVQPVGRETSDNGASITNTNVRNYMKKRNEEVSIKDILALFIPKIWLITLCAIVLGAVMGAYAMFFKADTYTSKASFTVSAMTTVSETDLKLSSKIIGVIGVHISMPDFQRDVSDSVNSAHEGKIKVTQGEIKSALRLTELDDGVPAFTIAVTTNDPQKSKAIADALVDYMVTDESGNAPIKNYLKEAYQKVRLAKIETPSLGSHNDKGVLTNAIIGALVGAVICMVIVYMTAMFDVVIHDRKKLEDHFDIPILGVIPKYENFQDEEHKGGTRGE